MKVETYQIAVRDAPQSVNAGGGGARANKYAAGKEKKRWEGLYAVELLAGKVRKGMTHCTVDVVVTFKRPNHRDEENFRHPVVKPLADTLVHFGYLPDDTKQFFEVRTFRLDEHPESWPYRHPGIKAVMDIRLVATYDN